MRYPVSGHKGVVAVDMHIISRDFGAWAAYEVLYLRIEYSKEQIIENITLPSLLLGINWSHYIKLVSTMLHEGKQAVASLSWYVCWQMWKIWCCEVLVRLRWNEDQRKRTLHGPFEGHTSQICSFFHLNWSQWLNDDRNKLCLGENGPEEGKSISSHIFWQILTLFLCAGANICHTEDHLYHSEYHWPYIASN